MNHPDRVTEMQSLGDGEQLILWAFRMVAVGRSGCPGLRRAFVETCGAGGEEAFISLFTFARYIGHRARRPIRLRTPGCQETTADEQSLLALFAAARDGFGGGRDDRLRAHFSWLVEGPPSEAVILMVKVVAQALHDAGAPLREPAPAFAPPPRVARPELRTIH